MTEEKREINLLDEFPPISTQEWEETIVRDLKGSDYNKKLIWNTIEGFDVKPYYRSEDLENVSCPDCQPGEFPFIRGNSKDDNSWLIREDIIVPDPKSANEKALDIINKGINSLNFIFEIEEEPDTNFFQSLLSDIDTENIEINISAGQYSALIPGLLKEIKFTGKGSIDVDPLNKLNRNGNFCVTVDKAFDVLKDIMVQAESLSGFRTLTIHGNTFRNAGSGIVQELAYSLSMGAEYLTRLTMRGMKVEQIAEKIKFQFATGSNYFFEIAKIRAARFLWAKILEAYGITDKSLAKMYIHSTSSEWNKTVYDPEVNMLRTTTETMSAIIGGADSITVDPYNKTFEKTNAFSERIARNQQHLLKEESYLDKVIDPAAGSYYIETLTNLIGEKAWELFLELDGKGGYLESLFAGFVQKQIKETANIRDQKIAERKDILLGTNQYPNFTESIKNKVSVLEKESKNIEEEELIVEPLRMYRGANAFEEMRYKTDIYSIDNIRPKVFMFTIGNLAMRRARSQFSSNFFGCAGFEITDNNGFKTIEEGVEAAINSKSDIVVVCGSDDDYSEIVPQVNTLLKDNAIIVVAGAPACMQELKKQGITNFINVRTNVLDELRRYQTEIKIC